MRNFILLLALCAGCAVQQTPEMARIVQTRDLDVVKGCRFVAAVAGAGNGWSLDDSMKNAQDFVLLKAGKLGATHLVWQKIRPDPLKSWASGDAYSCG